MSVSSCVFARLESAAENRMHPDCIKIVRRYDAPRRAFGPLADAQSGPSNLGHKKRVNLRAVLLQIEKIWPGNVISFGPAAHRCGDSHQPLLVDYGRVRTEQNPFDPTKHSCIGANAAVFSWVEGILFRPYPAVVHQERLMAVTATVRGGSEADYISWPDFLDLKKNCTQIDSFFVTKITGTTLSVGERAESTTGSIVSANYFDAIGVHPILGRGFEPSEDTGRNAHPVVVISYQLWQRRFKGDREIIGKTQRLSGVVHTIVGVAPEGFYGTFVGWAMQFWVPASMEEIFEEDGYKLEDRGARWIESYVRLKPGVTVAQAQGEISAVAKRLEADYPETNRGRGVKLWLLWQTPFNNARTLLPTFEIMLAVVVFVLLIACANVGNLQLVRSLARRREMTVRLAIGAGRRRLVKQLFTEGLILSTFGAVGGLVVAYWCRDALVLLFPARGGLTMYLPNQIDCRVLGLSAGVCLVATVVLGL